MSGDVRLVVLVLRTLTGEVAEQHAEPETRSIVY
jgi:hypothetical protein